MNEDVKAMIAAIEQATEDGGYTLTEWEDGFLKSVTRLLDANAPISDKQDAVLVRIWEKATR